MKFDPHIHLLPGTSDGPHNLTDLDAMLRIMDENHVHHAVVVTHLHFQKDIVAHYKYRIQEATHLLQSSLKKSDSALSFCIAPEIDFYEGLFRSEDMHPYVIPRTNYLMVDLPLGSLNDESVRDIAYLIQRQRILPVFCQIERHILMDEPASLARLLGIANARFLLSSSALVFRGIIDAALKYRRDSGRSFLLGSNAHNSQSRRPIYLDELRISDTYTKTAVQYMLKENEHFKKSIFPDA